MEHVPHDQITPGFWYIRTQVEPFFCIVNVMMSVYGENEGELVVYTINEEREYELAAYDEDQFIGLVPSPF